VRRQTRAKGAIVTEKDFDVQGFARDINELLVLSTLRADAKHGYQIALDVETDSNGLFRFKHGTLYPILHRLEGEGLIKGSWSKPGGRRRKVYALTGAGRRHFTGETTRVEEIVSRLMLVLRRPGEAPV
jgi:DNA-binding PadR family transcriptional regulator